MNTIMMRVYTTLLREEYEYSFVSGYENNNNTRLPLTSKRAHVIALIVYITTVYIWDRILGNDGGGKQRHKQCSKRDGKEKKVKKSLMTYVVFLHNIILCVWSVIMFCMVVVDIKNTSHSYKYSIAKIVCDEEKRALSSKIGSLVAYLYYISKFYELIDTYILLIKRKKVIFLHVYHHAIMLVMTYKWITSDFKFHWYD